MCICFPSWYFIKLRSPPNISSVVRSKMRSAVHLRIRISYDTTGVTDNDVLSAHIKLNIAPTLESCEARVAKAPTDKSTLWLQNEKQAHKRPKSQCCRQYETKAWSLVSIYIAAPTVQHCQWPLATFQVIMADNCNIPTYVGGMQKDRF